MANIERLSAVVCHDLTAAIIDETQLEAELREAMQSGGICPGTGAQLLDLVHEVEESTREAYVGAEKSDEVLANFSYYMKVGMGAPVHQYLRERRQDVAALCGAQKEACSVLAPQARHLVSKPAKESSCSHISTGTRKGQEVRI